MNVFETTWFPPQMIVQVLPLHFTLSRYLFTFCVYLVLVSTTMATIEDRILDGPRVYYCDEDEVNRQGDDIDENHIQSEESSASLFVRPDEETERLERAARVSWQGNSTNTGPKGVIEDYKRKKTVNNQHDSQADDLEAEFRELMTDDSILKEFIAKRIASNNSLPTFGHVFHLKTGEELLDAIDQEAPEALVLVHLYTKYSRSCKNMNLCLEELAAELRHIKFVTLDASATPLSGNFKDNAVPALLAYRSGDLVNSLLQVDELLDRNFEAQQIKDLLMDNNLT